MKRNLLAIAIPALLVAGTASASIEIWNKDGNKLDLYGRVKAANVISAGGSKDLRMQDTGDETNARLGLLGETQVTDSLTGYGRMEVQKDASGEQGSELRYAFAGLNFGKAGAVDYGRNDGVQKAITAYTDVLPDFGGDAAKNSRYVLSSRADGVLTYRNNELLDGLKFAVQYADRGIREEGKQFVVDDENASGYGLNAQYDILDTGLTVGASYAATEKYKGTSADKKRANSYMAGIKYDANNLYLAGIYAYQKHDQAKHKGFELVAQYGIDLEVGRFTPSLAYIQHKDDKATKQYSYFEKYVDVGATYDFNKNLQALVDYKINLKRDGVKIKDVIGLGLIYQF